MPAYEGDHPDAAPTEETSRQRLNRSAPVMLTEDEIEDETIDTTPAWEIKIPLGLLAVGLSMLVIHGLIIKGARGGAGMLIGIGAVLLIYLPITIAAMFIAAPLSDVSFGELRPAIAKIAGIYVFTFALQDVLGALVHPAVGWLVGPGVSMALFSMAFDLTFAEAFWAVSGISLVRAALAVLIGLVIARLVPQ